MMAKQEKPTFFASRLIYFSKVDVPSLCLHERIRISDFILRPEKLNLRFLTRDTSSLEATLVTLKMFHLLEPGERNLRLLIKCCYL